jgi:hypothetical protein
MPRTWIFQSNPESFDLDNYLRKCPGTFLFIVKRYAEQIAAGDTVFIWQAKGKTDGSRAGIVAEAQVISPVKEQPDEPASLPFWADPSQAHVPENRVRLQLVKHAKAKECLKREWLLHDSALGDLLVLRQPAETTFPVGPTESVRLRRLWDKTGTDWSEAESTAALWVYDQTYGKPVSKLKGSPVEQLAQVIGRAPGSVYNKLMNFRSLDDRIPVSGFTGINRTDKVVWERYYDAALKRLDSQALEAAYRSFWEKATDPATEFDSEVRRLAKQPLADLLQQYQKGSKGAPLKSTVSVITYQRSALVVAITKLRAGWRCEVAECASPVAFNTEEEPIVEVHHLERLADGGPDTLENTVCVCPNHHRELHLGRRAKELRRALEQLRAQDVLQAAAEK